MIWFAIHEGHRWKSADGRAEVDFRQARGHHAYRVFVDGKRELVITDKPREQSLETCMAYGQRRTTRPAVLR